MQQLTNEYGINKAFKDEELFDKIASFTYPEVKTFLETYVAGSTPIPYETFFDKVGITNVKTKTPGNVFLKGQMPYISVNQSTKEIFVLPNIELPTFYSNLGIKGNDIIQKINNTNYTLDNIYDMITSSQTWKENDAIKVSVKRDGKEIELKGTIKLPFEDTNGLQATNASKASLKNAWLNG